ncbi:MAG: hypothetical protein KGH61_03445 [Candidatus Micrarchaeota archaeon]|nr:hypothetical protein [Candidatus Micrarchaeota archaeon]MDE1847977.1 hypothetical protein [Candidatus Micrarchaeota archaeon]MDE1864680.1 hypothetical protein [Candidatus Micrarchaeota archaeon]
MTSEDLKELVIARLSVMPPNRKIAIGGYGEFTKEELIHEVNNDTEIGKKIVEIEISFIRAVAQGKIYG